MKVDDRTWALEAVLAFLDKTVNEADTHESVEETAACDVCQATEVLRTWHAELEAAGMQQRFEEEHGPTMRSGAEALETARALLKFVPCPKCGGRIITTHVCGPPEILAAEVRVGGTACEDCGRAFKGWVPPKT